MRTMQEIMHFNEKSTLLVACPEYCNAGTANYNIWPPVITHTPLGKRDHVQVIFLNCSGKNAITEQVEKIIEELKREPQELEIMQNLAFFEIALKKIKAQETAPLYNKLQAQAERIVGPAYAGEQNAMYVHLGAHVAFPTSL